VRAFSNSSGSHTRVRETELCTVLYSDVAGYIDNPHRQWYLGLVLIVLSSSLIAPYTHLHLKLQQWRGSWFYYRPRTLPSIANYHGMV